MGTRRDFIQLTLIMSLEDKGPSVITLRVDGLKYDSTNGTYMVTLTDDLQFEIKDASRIINIDQGSFASMDSGNNSKTLNIQNNVTPIAPSVNESIFTRT